MDYVASRRLMIEQNGFALSKTFGSSMRPLIWGGQHCVAVVQLDGEPRVGDILMFVQTQPDGSERNIVHRLVDIKENDLQRLYITRGDNCLGCEQVKRDEIIGLVAEVHRTSGFRPWHIIPRKQFSMTDPSYIIYSQIWASTWPVRQFYYRLRAKVQAIRARLTSIIKGKER